ncbi:MAG: YbaN family protein, partial [Gemmatimonadetes bacterium]|nr:YbaN family protein [Gemmatimonadota bacterium]
MRQPMRILFFVIGTMSVVAGVVGILLPLIPTTPFLLLAAWCYARSSERFYRLLLSNRWLGPYIRNYRDGRGMSLRAKVS